MSRSPMLLRWLHAALACSMVFGASRALSGCGDEPLGDVFSGGAPNVATLAVGTRHVCALRGGTTTNEVVCWGSDGHGRLGVAVAGRCLAAPGLTGVLQVAAGFAHSCALLSGGTVRCWGANWAVSDSSVTTDVSGLAGVTQIAAGALHTCALLTGGTVRCWGTFSNIELGDSSVTTDVRGLSGAAQLALGDRHTCARMVNGTVRCWGADNFGQLGGSSTTTAVPRLSGVAHLTAGANHTCVVHDRGVVRCWGSNGFGELAGSSTTTDIPGLNGVTRVAAGDRHTCALLDVGTVRCWGDNTNSQLAGSSTTQNVPGLTDVVEIASGGMGTCARRRDGSVRCWGDNDAGQLGVPAGPATATLTTPVCIPSCASSAPATPATCGLTCVDTQTNNAHCGACDTPCTDGRTCRAGMCQAPTSCPTGQTSCGTPAICVDTQTDARHCGRCGNALPTGQLCVATQPAAARATQLTAGDRHTCAIAAGAVRCWGDDEQAQRGDGDIVSGEVCSGPAGIPVPGMPPVDAVELAAGNQHTCARLADGTVRCWGRNGSGELGDGGSENRSSPVAVMGLSNAAEIVAGNRHTCARLMDGTVRCWGDNTAGQFGDGSTASRRSPVTVTGLTGVVQIAAGWFHTCARLMDGTARCWGNNINGQLGDGTNANRLSPVAVMGLTNVVELAAGTFHTCARLMDGTVRCWGDNRSAQLGDGTRTTRSAPVAVACFATSTTSACPTGQTSCGMPAACVDTATSPAHCGGCGMACALSNVATHTCAASVCGVGTCAPNFGNCDGMAANGCETNTQTSAAHCGACNNACASGQTCVNGACASGCTMTDCSGACVNTQTDTAHCGGCSRACALANVATQSCASGACGVGACATGFGNCDTNAANGCETNTQTNTAHCGGCGMACGLANVATHTCAAGSCGVGTCAMGFGNCDGMAANGCETNTQTSAAHCGACNNACPSGQSCAAGVCTPTVTAPGDACAMPLALDLTPTAQTVMGTTAGASSSTEGCAGGADVFYRFTLTRRELVYFDTFGTSFDTQLRLHTNNCAMAVGSCVDNSCSGSQSQLVATLDAGTYVLAVDGATGASGAFTLRAQHLPVGSGPVNTLASMSGTQTVMATTSGASGLTTICGNGVGPEAVWWLATCADFAGGAFTAATCGGASFDTVVEQRSATRTPIALCDDDGCGRLSTVTGMLPSGAGLHTVTVDGFGAMDAGAVTLTVTLTPSGSCTLPSQTCGGTCVNTQTSTAHCGTCNNACAGGQTCVAGVCTGGGGCPTGQTSCGGGCVDTNTSPMNCGGCGVPCFPPNTCSGGVCGMGGGGCPTGQTSCFGTCVDTRSNAQNCGACGNSCSGGVCVNSGCRTLSSQTAGTTSTAGNSAGAQPFNDLCGAMWGLVGFDTWASAGLNGAAAVCRQILVDLPGGVPTVTLGTNAVAQPTRGSASGTMASVRCPAGQVAVGFTGSTSGIVSRVALRCAPLTAMIAGNDLVFGVGSVSTTAEVGGAMGTAFGPFDCASGRYASGASFGVNSGIAALSLTCDRLITF